MIAYRLEFWGVHNPFSGAAAMRSYALTGAVPRAILLTCQNALRLARARKIDASVINAVFEELSIRRKGKLRPSWHEQVQPRDRALEKPAEFRPPPQPAPAAEAPVLRVPDDAAQRARTVGLGFRH